MAYEELLGRKPEHYSVAPTGMPNTPTSTPEVEKVAQGIAAARAIIDQAKATYVPPNIVDLTPV